MKKIICRRVFAFVLSAVMCITLCGCSSSEQKTTDTTDTVDTADAAATTNIADTVDETAATATTDTADTAAATATTDTPAAMQSEADSEIYEAISQMTLEQKLSQMILQSLPTL